MLVARRECRGISNAGDGTELGGGVRVLQDPLVDRRPGAKDVISDGLRAPETVTSAGGKPGNHGASDRATASQRRVSIHVVVISIVVALIAPAVGFLAYVVHQQNEERQREIGALGAQLADDIAGRLEQEFTALTTILSVFATSGWLEADELARLHRRATSALAGTDRHLIVLDEQFEQLLNTRVAFGTPLGKTSDPDTAAQAQARRELVVSDVFHGRVADAAVFNVLRPVVLPDGRERVLILTRNAASLDALFGLAARSESWSFAVLDGTARVVTAAIAPREPEAIPSACRGEAADPRGDGADDTRHLTLSPVNGTSWSVCAWVSEKWLSAGSGRSWSTLFVGIVAWIGAALLAAVLLSALISRAIADTARVGEALDAGQDVVVPSSFIAEIDEVRRSLASAAAERVLKDERLQLLLREMVHRAKNQLALAVSLVDLSARNADSAADLQSNLTGRLMALGRSIDAVTGTEPDAASLGELIRAQLEPFADHDGGRLETRGGAMLISERAAQSLSLVLHELATNAAKYGAWSHPTGKLVIGWRADGERLVLDWSETSDPVNEFGNGSSEGPVDGSTRTANPDAANPDATDPDAGEPTQKGFGTTLVDTLVGTALGGTINRRFTGAGFSCRITLPLDRIGPAA